MTLARIAIAVVAFDLLFILLWVRRGQVNRAWERRGENAADVLGHLDFWTGVWLTVEDIAFELDMAVPQVETALADLGILVAAKVRHRPWGTPVVVFRRTTLDDYEHAA